MGDARHADWDSYMRSNYGDFDFKVPGDSNTKLFPDWQTPVDKTRPIKQDPISWQPAAPYERVSASKPLMKVPRWLKQDFASAAKKETPKLHKIYQAARRAYGAIKPLAMAGYRAVKSFLKPPSAACGGKVTKTGVVKVHKGEMIVSAKHAKKAQRALADIAKRAKKTK